MNTVNDHADQDPCHGRLLASVRVSCNGPNRTYPPTNSSLADGPSHHHPGTGGLQHGWQSDHEWPHEAWPDDALAALEEAARIDPDVCAGDWMNEGLSPG